MKAIVALIVTLVAISAFGAEIDHKKSKITWRGSKITGDYHIGQMFIKSSNLKLDGDKFINGDVTLDLKTFTVSNLEGEWATKFLNHMKSKDFFNVKKHPTAKLKITSVGNNQASGNLTIMGKTQKVSFPFRKSTDKYVGKLSFDRTKFGMVYGSGNFFKNLGDKVINDLIEVDFEIFVKKSIK